MYKCGHNEKKKASDSCSSTSQFHQTDREQLCRRQMEKKQILPPNLSELSILQSSYFSDVRRGCLTRICNRGRRLEAVSPPPAHTPHPFTLSAILSPWAPRSVQVKVLALRNQAKIPSVQSTKFEIVGEWRIHTPTHHNKLETLSSETNQNCSGIKC